MTISAGPVLKHLYQEFGDRVAFVTLYVREAHPGEHHPQPSTFAEKWHHAGFYQEHEQIPWRVAVDPLGGDLHRALDPKPNAAYLMDTDGTVAFRVLWSNDEKTLREGLEAIVSRRRLPFGERAPMVLPMLRGMGLMEDVLNEAGQDAKQDVQRALPPMYALARVAAIFQPLPPLGRSLAALAVTAVGVAVVVGSLRWLLRTEKAESIKRPEHQWADSGSA